MQIGVAFPQIEMPPDPGVVRDFVQTAEALGYCHVLAFDHVLGAVRSGRDRPLTGPYSEADPFHEPLMMFSYMAAVSTRIGFVTGVLVLPQRQTALVAKQAAELSILSEGRFRMGVGVGWNYVEFESLGMNFHDRGHREDEQIQVLRELWASPVADLDLPHHRIDRAGILPRPARPIEIWVGGLSRPAYERAARLGDGLLLSQFPADIGGAERAVSVAKRVVDRVRELGRDADTFGLEGRVEYSTDPEAVAAEVDTYRQGGFRYVTVSTVRHGIGGPAEHLAAIERYATLAGVTPGGSGAGG